MTGASDDSRGRADARPWIVVGSLLALGAAVAMVLTDDFRWLRLGIVAALWAALLGAFMAARNHKHARVSEQAARDAQTVYELELEREVAARREHELEVTSEARARADSETRDEIESLRSEIGALRDSLQQLMGGELLYERVALTAQSTRMRHVGDQAAPSVAGSAQQAAEGAEDVASRQVQRALDPGVSQQSEDGQTEVFRRVPAAEQRESRGAGVAREQGARSSDSERPDTPPTPAEVSARPRQQPRQQPRRPQRQPAQAPLSPAARSQPASQQQRGAAQSRTDVTGGSQAHPPATARPSNGSRVAAEQAQQSARQLQRAERTPQQPGNQPQPPPNQPQQPDSQPQQRSNQPGRPSGTTQQPGAPARPGQAYGDIGAAAAESRQPAQAGDQPGDGDERAESAATETPSAQPAQDPDTTEASGSHAEGRSVSELLAAYGSAAGPGSHRRRRAQ